MTSDIGADQIMPIAINGKFLGANLNGVHRTAAYYSRELMRRAADHAQNEGQVRLLTPPGAHGNPDFPGLVGQPVGGRFGVSFGGGQGWEMLTLPSAARGSLLVNFCNLAPLLHGNSVVMIHDAQTFLYPQDFTGKQAIFYRLLLPLIARRARRILTVSEFSRGSLAAHGIGTPEKISVVHNGTDHILDNPADPAILAQHGLAAGKFVLTMGSSKYYKNMRVVFDAMRAPLPSGHTLVVAGGPGAQAYRAAGWEPPAGTIFTGFVSDGELRALYESAAVFVFPSLTEGFGLPPVEAMHCGSPVVSARAGAMPEVLGPEVQGSEVQGSEVRGPKAPGAAALLVQADQPGEYRQAIMALLADAELHAKMREAGRVRASQLSWKAAGDRLWSLIRPLAIPG